MSEDREQMELVAWFIRTFGVDAAQVLHHSPNGGKRDVRTAQKLKLMGVRKGFPDLALYLARGGFTGCAVELKPTTPKRKPTPDQVRWIAHLRSIGWQASVCYGFAEAAEFLQTYMRGDDQ
jgi:hypothetical protein